MGMKLQRIFREKSKSFTVINNEIVKDRELSTKAKGLMLIVMSLPPDWDFSINGLTSIVKEGKRFVYAAINELREHGYVTREQVREEGKIAAWAYTFYEQVNNKEKLEKLDAQNVDVENVDVQNSPQLNTNQIKNSHDQEVLEVFDYWKVTFKHPNAKLDTKRKTRILNHLKNGFNPNDLKAAIYGATKSPWHMGDNPTKTVYDKIDTIFRDSDQVEHFIDLSTKTVSNIQATRVTPMVTAPCALCSTTKKCKFHDEFSEYNRSKIKHVF